MVSILQANDKWELFNVPQPKGDDIFSYLYQ